MNEFTIIFYSSILIYLLLGFIGFDLALEKLYKAQIKAGYKNNDPVTYLLNFKKLDPTQYWLFVAKMSIMILIFVFVFIVPFSAFVKYYKNQNQP